MVKHGVFCRKIALFRADYWAFRVPKRLLHSATLFKTGPDKKGKNTMLSRRSSIIAGGTIALAFVVLLAGPLTKIGLLPWLAGLGLFALGSLAAAVGGLICLVIVIRNRGGLLATGGMVAGLAAAAVLAKIITRSGNVPQVHDITTDTVNPPLFVSITPALRGAGSNSITYDPAVAPKQAAAYPGVRPRTTTKSPAQMFDIATKAVVARGWTVVGADSATGRIEATDASGWWGFKDDVVIRLRPDGEGTRVDIRSVSRVGRSDLGANAARIEKLMAEIAG